MSPKDRKTYLSMAERRAQPGSGSVPFEVRERASAFAPPQVRRLLGDLPFAIVGGLATRLYMPERMTLDVVADISRMLGVADAAEIDRTRALVTRHRPADAEDLESIIRLGRIEQG